MRRLKNARESAVEMESDSATRTCAHCRGKFVLRRIGCPSRFCSSRCCGLSRRTTGLTAKSLNHHGYVTGKVWRGDRRVSVLEHRWVMEQHLGRQLNREESVHHINGDRTDNRIDNLRLYASVSEHLRAEHSARRARGA